MSATWAPTIQDTEKLVLAMVTVPLTGTGTFNAMTAVGGDVLIQDVSFYLKTPAAGLVSLSVQTDDTTPTTLLASIVLLNLLTTKNLAAANNALVYLPSGKSLKYTIVGTATGGSLVICVRYYKTTIGSALG